MTITAQTLVDYLYYRQLCNPNTIPVRVKYVLSKRLLIGYDPIFGYISFLDNTSSYVYNYAPVRFAP